jgi:hypothetical protein
MKPPELATMRIRVLRRHLYARRFAVPKLQRNFVWDAGRAAKLLDSIYRDMPIGSLFLWEMDRKSANLIRQSAEVLPPFDIRNKRIWFVIDGQQRLSVIHQAFEADVRQNDAGRDIDFSRLCFVVKPDRGQNDPARVVYRKSAGRNLVPIRDILAPDWKKRMPRKGRSFIRKIHDCRERLLKYPLPVVIVRSATLAEIGEVFIRVNSQGMRITSADRAIALMGKLDVRAMAHELRQRLRDKRFALTTIDPILMGFNLIAEQQSADGDPPKLEAMARRWSRGIQKDEAQKIRFRRLWHKYQNAFRLAVDCLRQRFPVYDESYLPSANMLATLAVFFFHHSAQPNRRQAAEIRKWFWATGVAQRYSGRGYHRNIVADARFFRLLARGARRHFALRDRLDPVLDIKAVEYGSRAARARAFFCLLASRTPRYLENGEPIPLDQGVISHANRRHRHHIFPRGQLKNHFSPRVYNSLCNVCFLVSSNNLAIGMRLPRRYLQEYRDRSRTRFRRVMKSHLIPAGDEDGVWGRSIVAAFKQFREERLSLICQAFEKEAGMKLFRRD